MISSYPVYSDKFSYKSEEDDVEKIIEAITKIRAQRREMNVPPSKKAKLYVVTKYSDTFAKSAKILEKLASASEVIVSESYENDNAVTIATGAGTLYIPLSEVIDFDKERARLSLEMKKNDEEIARIERKLQNEGFVAKAPKAVIDGERAKLEKYKETKASLESALEKLN
jgi:valyl-tRNA synthetase